MTKITIDIKSCQDCPFFEKKRHYTEDSWEQAHDWYCKNEKVSTIDGPREIEGYVSWNEEKDVKIPDWCPVKVS